MSNWEAKGLAADLTGTETLPVNQSGATKYATVNMIITLISSAFEAAGAIAAHLAAYTHGDIAHSNRTDLDNVSGTNTGDQDLSGLLDNTDLQLFLGLNAAATAPVSPVANQFWIDTSLSPHVVKQRSADNSAWVSLYSLRSSGLEFENDIYINGIRVGTGGAFTTNTVLGLDAFISNTTGNGNSAIGRDALSSNTTGTFNAAIGGNALGNNETGSYNVAIGAAAGQFWSNALSMNKTPEGCTYLGQGTRSSAAGNTNETVIGYDTLGSGSNTVTLGNTSVVATILRGNVSVPALTTGIATRTTSTFTPDTTVTSIIANYAGTMTITLPSAASFTGRMFTIKTITANTVVSASANVIPLAGGSAGTAIIAATAGKFAVLQSDGANWQIMLAN